jgi:hypothetical protein
VDLSNIIVPKDLKIKPVVTCVVEGILEESDLAELMLSAPALGSEPVADDDPSDLKKIREKHHSVARMIAGGLSQRMVSQLCGYSESYLSVLLNNPSMQELVELYRMQNGEAAQVIVEKLKSVGLKAIEALEEKLDAGDKLNNQELLSLAKLGLDRGGHGPSSSHHVVNEQHTYDYAELARMNDEARKRSAGNIVPAETIRQQLLPKPDNEQDDKNETDRNLGAESAELHEDRQQ